MREQNGLALVEGILGIALIAMTALSITQFVVKSRVDIAASQHRFEAIKLASHVLSIIKIAGNCNMTYSELTDVISVPRDVTLSFSAQLWYAPISLTGQTRPSWSTDLQDLPPNSQPNTKCEIITKVRWIDVFGQSQAISLSGVFAPMTLH